VKSTLSLLPAGLVLVLELVLVPVLVLVLEQEQVLVSVPERVQVPAWSRRQPDCLPVKPLILMQKLVFCSI